MTMLDTTPQRDDCFWFAFSIAQNDFLHTPKNYCLELKTYLFPSIPERINNAFQIRLALSVSRLKADNSSRKFHLGVLLN